MVDKKTKTKAAMMQELESIKGLLLEDDEIPILQEIFDSEPGSKATQAPMSRHELNELHDQFTALSQSIAGKHTEPQHSNQPQSNQPQSSQQQSSQQQLPPQTSASLLDAFTRVSQQQAPKTAQAQQTSILPKLQQPSLFHEEEFVEDIDQYHHAASHESQPGQNISTSHSSTNHSNNHTQRPALAKASGENPFLPQHIRARLHGNNPPPMFDYAASAQLPQTTLKNKTEPLLDQYKNSLHDNHHDGQKSSSPRQQLIKEVIAAVMPQLEKELQQKLEQLSQQELERLRHSDT
jgi:hypothetical protein